MRNDKILGAFVSLTVLLMGFGMMEITFRLIDKKRPELYNERNTLYRYDSALGWYPKPNFQGMFYYEPHQPVWVRHNSMGFRDREHEPKRHPVLAILGDSYVYGFNVDQKERFSELLGQKMPGWEIYNLGVSGYGTDQEYLLLRKLFDPIQPDAVLLIFCSNDHDDNSTNRRYGYYKPYFDMRHGRLALSGVPVPKSLLYFPSAYPLLFKSVVVARMAEMIWRPIAGHYWPTVRVPDPTGPLLLMMRDEVEKRGATFEVGFIGYGPEEKAFCQATHLYCFETNSSHVYKTAGGHWNVEGHREVAEQIDRYLRTRALLPQH